MNSFWSELKRRNVVRVGAAYLAGTWLSLQIADTVLPNLDAPAWIMIALIYSAAIGFPFALIRGVEGLEFTEHRPQSWSESPARRSGPTNTGE